MSEKLDTTISHADDAEVRGVNNAALAVATMQQKPKLLSKSMLKVCIVSLNLFFSQSKPITALLVHRRRHA